MKFQNETDRSLFLKVFRSYSLMVIVPIVLVSVIMIVMLLTKIGSDVNRLNETIFIQCQEKLDDKMDSMNAIMYQLMQNEDVINFIYTEYPEGAVKFFYGASVVEKIAIYQTEDIFFNNFAIYSSRNNAVIDGSMLYTPEEYFGRWEGLVPAEWTGSGRTSKCVQHGDELIYARPLSGSLNPADKLIVTINLNSIFSMFDALRINGDWCFVISDRSGEVLSNSNAEINIDRLPEFDGRSGEFTYRAGNVKFDGTYNFSGAENLVYACLIPENGLSGDVHRIIWFFVIIVLISLLVCGTMALFSANGSYKFIKRTLDEKLKFNHNIEKMYGVVRENVLINLLNGLYNTNPGERDRIITQYGLSEFKEQPTVIKVGISDIGDSSSLFDVTDALEEKFASLGIKYEKISIKKESLVYILRLAGIEIVPVLEDVLGSLKSNSAEGVNIGVGEQVSDINKVHISYHKATEALNCAFREGNSMTVSVEYPEIAEGDADYRDDVKSALCNCVRVGEVERTEAIFDEIYKNNFADKSLEHNFQMALNCRIAATLLEMLDVLFIKNTLRKRSYINICNQVLSEHDAQTGFEMLKIAFQDLAKQMKETREEERENRIDDILLFIEENYSNKDLSLAMLADCFYLNYQYLSKLFIAETGTYFVNYLNLFRLEKSKKLLSDTKLKIEEVAGRVGFTNANSYIRTFKKYNSVTPGEYRKSMQQNA